MKSIRSYRFLAVLILGVAGIAPAQDTAQGFFTLPYEVHWEKAVVPAGEYAFFLRPFGPSEVLTLQRMHTDSPGFLIMVQQPEASTSIDLSRLTMVSKGSERFVTSMQLSKYGMILRFAVPDEIGTPAKEVAQAGAAAMPAR